MSDALEERLGITALPRPTSRYTIDGPVFEQHSADWSSYIKRLLSPLANQFSWMVVWRDVPQAAFRCRDDARWFIGSLKRGAT